MEEQGMKNCDEYWDIETAFLRGRDVLVVIKTGAGGTVNGYQDKYKKWQSIFIIGRDMQC